jgi:SnoaL-like domain
MTMTYQQQLVLESAAARGAILDLSARHNRLFSAGDVFGWIATFRHSGAMFVRGAETFTDLRAGFDGHEGQRLVTVDHEITVDGVNAIQHSVALLFAGTELRATGTYQDRLVYERGAWYFATRELHWDAQPSYAAASS